MTLDFPSRFLKKLDIYQQIRSGQGISKYKRLWRYEAAFLITAYSESHQNLNSFIGNRRITDWIKQNEPDYSRRKYEEIIGNLFWKGYLEAKDKKEKISNLFTRDSLAADNKPLAQNYEFRPTPDGLLVGEVLTEINSKNIILKFCNLYKYNFILDIIWLIIFWGLVQLFFKLNLSTVFLITLFIGWTPLMWLLRKLNVCLEGNH